MAVVILLNQLSGKIKQMRVQSARNNCILCLLLVVSSRIMCRARGSGITYFLRIRTGAPTMFQKDG